MSLERLLIPGEISLDIIVVDNDRLEFARAIVEEVRKQYKHNIIYSTEPKKNISAARNKCLELSKGELIAFIDDDEIAMEDWLLQLIKTMKQFNADIVFGRVTPTYPKETPSWIINGGFFVRNRPKTGTLVSSGGCGCTLIKASLLVDNKFDLKYGLTGGEDSELFYRLYQLGAILVYSDEAEIKEEVEKNRLNITYLINRKIRTGKIFSSYRYSNKNSLSKFAYVIKATIGLSIFTILTILFFPTKKEKRYNYLLRACDYYGKLSYFFDKKIEQTY